MFLNQWILKHPVCMIIMKFWKKLERVPLVSSIVVARKRRKYSVQLGFYYIVLYMFYIYLKHCLHSKIFDILFLYSGLIFAAKFIPVSHSLEKELIRREIDIMNQLHHPKLINLHDAFEDDDEMVLIYEL